MSRRARQPGASKAWPGHLTFRCIPRLSIPPTALIAVLFSLPLCIFPDQHSPTDPSPTAILSDNMGVLDGLPIKVSPISLHLPCCAKADFPAAHPTPHHHFISAKRLETTLDPHANVICSSSTSWFTPCPSDRRSTASPVLTMDTTSLM